MSPDSKCPEPERFQLLSTGRLTLAEVERLAQHLEQCLNCSETIQSMCTEDRLLGIVRSETNGEGENQSEGVQEILARVRQRVISQSGSTDQTHAFQQRPQSSDDAEELRQLAQYRIVRLLGRGGMGLVYEAEDPDLQRNVALKVMKKELAENEEARARFLLEARSAASIEHDHVVSIYQVGEDQGTPFLAMQLLKGCSLSQLLEKHEGRLTIPQALRIGKQIALGLDAAHEHQMIHRDIKPANIWIEPVGGGRVKLLDFGLARSIDTDARMTQSGMILGTPAYMAPEQAQGKDVDSRCDLFSLGCALYEMTTGELPFLGDNAMSVLMSVATHHPESPSTVSSSVPPELSALILQLISKDPSDRPESAKAVAKTLQTLEQTYQSDVHTERIEDADSSPTTSRRPRRRALVAMLVALCILIPLGWMFGGTIVRFVTNKGELVVEVQDPSVEVAVFQGKLKVKDRTGNREFLLSAGKGEIQVYEKDGVGPLLTKEFTLNRGGKTTITVTLKELADAKPGAKDDELWAVDFSKDPNAFAVCNNFKFDLKNNTITTEAWVTPLTDGESGGSRGIVVQFDTKAGRSPYLYTGIHPRFHNWRAEVTFKGVMALARTRAVHGKRIHVTAVKNEKFLLLFLDGQLAAKRDITNAYFPVTNQLLIGVKQIGLIDEIRITNKARYSENFTPPERFDKDDATIALYHFDEGKGKILKDSSGNGHHATIYNAKWVRITPDGSLKD